MKPTFKRRQSYVEWKPVQDRIRTSEIPAVVHFEACMRWSDRCFYVSFDYGRV